jgi:hypoxanthine phosphoribosyltransferase
VTDEGGPGLGGSEEATAPPVDVLISKAALRRRITELADELSQSFAAAREPPVFIGVLKGSTLFLADLIRELEIDVAIDFMSISSYSQTATQSGVVRIVKDLEQDIVGREVLIVEDIVDTGLTLTYLRRALTDRGPGSLRALTLLDRTARRIVPVDLEFRGFEIPDVFVVGYGLDFMGLYRNAADILSVRDLPRLANNPRLLVEPLWGSRRGP